MILPSHNDPQFEMFAFFEMTPDLVCIANKDGYFKKVNQAVIDKLGYTHEELFGRPISSFIFEEDLAMTGRRRKELLEGKALLNFQNRYVTKTQRVVWLDWTSIYVPDREVVFAIAKDITERKEEEESIREQYKKFKGLTTYFKSRIEKDRKYFAVELHEELAQLASVVKMDIDWVRNNGMDLHETSKKRLDHALSVSNVLVNAIRRITYSISPNMLDDVGLNETLRWLCEEFAILNGIPCVFETSYDTTNLPHEVQLDFFRICQESLSNVMYHAKASDVKIRIDAIGDKISLCIIDNGKGFEIAAQHETSGLANMRERAASVNGELRITSEVGKGTIVCFTVTQHHEEKYLHANSVAKKLA